MSITTLKELLSHKSIIMTLRYAKVAQEYIHAEYTEAIKKMSGQQIPRHLTKTKDSNELLAELGRLIAPQPKRTTVPSNESESRLSKFVCRK